MAAPKTIALIAAAGQSRRMKFPKALLAIKGETAASFLVKILFKYRLESYLTLPDFLLHERQFLATISPYQPHICRNNYEALGLSGSVKTVIEKAPWASGIFIIPVDAPFLSSALLELFLNLIASNSSKATIIVPYAFLRAGHPIYFSKHFFKDLLKCHDAGPAGLMAENQECVTRLFWPDARILFNLNHPEDLATMAGSRNPL